ncbi:hypothetical protein AB6Q85_002335 [Vibrio cholerae]
MQETNEDTIKARGQVAQLLNQLKDFKIKMQPNNQVRFEITTPKDEVISYLSAIKPYHWYSKHTGSIWQKETLSN